VALSIRHPAYPAAQTLSEEQRRALAADFD